MASLAVLVVICLDLSSASNSSSLKPSKSAKEFLSSSANFSTALRKVHPSGKDTLKLSGADGAEYLGNISQTKPKSAKPAVPVNKYFCVSPIDTSALNKASPV